MNVVIVSHPSRCEHVERLQHYLPVVTTVVNTVSAREGHRMALQIASSYKERVIIMEDDAIPVEGFIKKASEWCDLHPEDLVSFYLGTSRPKEHQPMVDERMRIADAQGRRELQMPTLLHGVCYSIPAHEVSRVLTKMHPMVREADFCIGRAWGRAVYYPLESLVQHRDEAPVERHPDGLPRNEPRVARRLAGPLMFNPTGVLL